MDTCDTLNCPANTNGICYNDWGCIGGGDKNMNERLKPHQEDYKPKAYEVYSFRDLGNWVHLFAERALHRANPEKLKKDLYDAKNYLAMMESKLQERCEELDIKYKEL